MAPNETCVLECRALRKSFGPRHAVDGVSFSIAAVHAWAVQALREVALRGGTIVDVTTVLVALAAFAGVLLAIGTWGLRRTLAGTGLRA